MTTYSISIRLQRTTVEEAYVSVPVTDAVMRAELAEDGTARLDTEKLFAAAVELGRADVSWEQEEQQITIHPIQQAPPGTA